MDGILIAIIAGLSPKMARSEEHCPNIASIAKSGTCVPVKPVLPAVTCSMQATYSTGLTPAEHGVVANGYYFRDTGKVELWQHSARLIKQPRIWDMLREKNPAFRTAVLFWWNALYSSADIVMNVAPIHEGNTTIPSCYSFPRNLYDECEAALGPFPLHRFWGPMTSIESSKWIADATVKVLQDRRPDLTLTYIPFLDYSTQKFGPESRQALADATALDALIGDLKAAANAAGAKLVLVSEYSLIPVTAPIAINRVLRENGLLDLRVVGGREYLDTGASPAFAMVDHQIAHVYLNDTARLKETAEILRAVEGVAEVLSRKEQKEYGIDHPNAGELVVLPQKDRWFSYYWWLDEGRAPGFAHTVDIHRKPGYDPVEMFVDPVRKCIPTDASLIKGSHGLVSDDPDEMAVLVSEIKLPVGDGPMPATEFASTMVNLFGKAK